ncbi:hypothetical protein BDP81DRAFT_491675 [Colletotrichum phormii]|uniref:Uncharacterized protein n=1 Tax=Colletotrichum phormii TaxID=359342 RepID=A0AAI9ZNV3_9PEZI|nr:uncharacterized protein BDP81DRAFT_491675 [Colletotrichum phormii]KAK1635115.1 hypothetical protein BDP81DRAFT_491675 [Colletotrichum phormii]
MSSTSKPSQSRNCGAWVEVLPGLVGTDGRHDEAPGGRAPVHEAVAAHSLALKAVGRLIPHANDDPNNYAEISAAIMCLFLNSFPPRALQAATMHARGIVGKSTFLGAPEWKEEPFRRVVEDPLQALLSEACAIPAIFEMLDHCNDNSGSAARKAVNQFVEAISRLNLWHKSANMTIGDVTRLQKASPADTSLEFPTITVANSLSHYWAFWIICATQIQRLRVQHP